LKADSSTQRAYLDYNATSPMRPEALEAVTQTLKTCWGNSSSAHSEGQGASVILEKARASVAAVLGVHSSEILFTSGGTESNNLGLVGLLSTEPGHAITTAIEHPSVMNTFKLLEKRGWRVTRVPCGPGGRIKPSDVAAAINQDTRLISVMHANNETGAIQPIPALASLAKKHRLYFHVDACQTVGRIPVAPKKMGVDTLSMSAHKFGGPKGIGALYVRKDLLTVVQPVSGGGSHERGLRPGTVNVAGAAGLAAALTVAAGGMEPETARLLALRAEFCRKVVSCGPFTVVGDTRQTLPNTVCVLVGEGLQAEDLMVGLDLKGVAVSTGAACAAGARRASPVLLAMFGPDQAARGGLRFSFGHATTRRDLRQALTALRRLV
jgi:cysteine desulfurase